MTAITIALDAMGGDLGAEVVVPAAINSLRNHPTLSIILVGDSSAIKEILSSYYDTDFTDRLHVHHTSQVVMMDEPPSKALRGKKDSSMRVALNLVKDGAAHACVSAGNTGALMAISRFVLKTLPGIDRPAIISEMPTAGHKCRVLDLGANVDSSPEHLLQFAIMGSVLASAVDKIPSPSVGLLNIGVEDIKGNEQVKQAAQLLSGCKALNYIGYVEGDEIFKGTTDVVVCDGFVGNVALKSSEGIAKLFLQYFNAALKKNVLTRLCAVLLTPILWELQNRMDPARYNGASFVGIKGIVIKSHGSASVMAFENAIHEAILQVRQDVPRLIHEKIAELYHEGHFI